MSGNSARGRARCWGSMWLSDDALRHLRETVARPEGAPERYRIVREIGRGGMGTVYLARDTELDRDVALKVLLRAGAGAEESERLLREARILACLEHPGIVPVHDAGT